MSQLLIGIAAFLLANLLAGLLRVMRGPAPADRLLALLLFGTITVAVLLLLSYAEGIPALATVALIVVALAAIAAVAFTQLPGIVDRGRRR